MANSIERRHFLKFMGIAAGAGVFTQTLSRSIAAPAKPQRFIAGFAPATQGTIESFWRRMDACSEVGFRNIETDNRPLQLVEAYLERVSEFQEEMAKRNLTLVGLNHSYPFTDPTKREEIIQQNIRICQFLEQVGGIYTGPQGALPSDEAGLRGTARLLNQEGRRAWEEYGIKLLYHTHSSTGFRRLMDLTNPAYVYLNPDLGWLTARGNLDPLEVVKAYRSRLMTVHFKDYDPNLQVQYQGRPHQGSMVVLGRGVVDFPAVVAFLKETDFAGCVMGELVGIGQYEFVRSEQAVTAYPAMKAYMSDVLGLEL